MSGAILVTPDAPLVVFWTLGLAALVELWRTGDARWLIALGAALGLALQSKFTAAFFAAGVLLALMTTPSLRRWLASPALFAGLAVALAIFAPFVVWNAAHDWATFAKQLGRAPPHGFAPFYIAEFLAFADRAHQPARFRRARPRGRDHSVARASLARLARRSAAHARLHNRRRRRSISFCTRPTTALRATGSRRFIRPSAILAADWVAEARRAGASGFSGAIAKTALWAAPIGLAFAALAFAEALTGAVPLGQADPAVRLEGFRELARDLDLRARAENAAYVLTQGYALTSLMTYYGDPAIAVVQPEQRMRWIFAAAAAGNAVRSARPRIGRSGSPTST